LENGLLADRVGRTRTARADDIAHRRAPITGVSEFALPDEAPLTRAAAPGPSPGALLPPARWAEPFEQLRDDVERRAPRPGVFLAALGPFAAHSRRVAFARNLFNAGGFRVVVGAPSEFATSGAQVACLCGPDESYRGEGSAAAAALREAGARRVWLTGPTAIDGVDDVITAGSNALEILRRAAEVATG
jgi:methylmalonyl-CoA mutase